MQVARRFEWPPVVAVVVVSISLHFFWLLLLLCLGREREMKLDTVSVCLPSIPTHWGPSKLLYATQPNTHQKYQVRFQRAQGK